MNLEQLAELEALAKRPQTPDRCERLAASVPLLIDMLRSEMRRHGHDLERVVHDHESRYTAQAAIGTLRSRLDQLETAMPDAEELEQIADLLDQPAPRPVDVRLAQAYLRMVADNIRLTLAVGVE